MLRIGKLWQSVESKSVNAFILDRVVLRLMYRALDWTF